MDPGYTDPQIDRKAKSLSTCIGNRVYYFGGPLLAIRIPDFQVFRVGLGQLSPPMGGAWLSVQAAQQLKCLKSQRSQAIGSFAVLCWLGALARKWIPKWRDLVTYSLYNLQLTRSIDLSEGHKAIMSLFLLLPTSLSCHAILAPKSPPLPTQLRELGDAAEQLF